MNLSTEQVNDFAQQRSSVSLGMMAVTIAFFLTAGVTGGFILWKNNLKKQLTEAETAYQTKYDQLLRMDRASDVVDFQNRITMANELIKERNVALDSLQFVEKSMVPGVFLTAYKNDKKTDKLSMEGVAENYEAIAKQTLSFKSSEFFSGVDVAKVGLSPEGKIIFSMEIKTN